MTGGPPFGRSFRQAPRGTRRVAVAAALAVAFACVGGWESPPPAVYHRTTPVEGAGARIGAEACAECHASFEGHFMASDGHGDCEACHGAAELHRYTARAGDIAYPSSEDCAACHRLQGKALLGWTGSSHARADILCSDCHDTHDREPWLLRAPDGQDRVLLPRASSRTRLCAGCHPGVVAQLGLPSHHPVAEGMMDCTDCHGAHGDRAVSSGRPTAVCADCHQEVVGPWIHEHPPVSEDCGYCHAPHGASADFLLEAGQPASCISCHTVATAGAIHDPFAFTTRCTDCHDAVHGSATDPVLRR